MDDRRANIEVIAPSVEEAIEQGLQELGLPREAVEVEVLDEGSRGLFGLGTRQARIRLTVRQILSREVAKPSGSADAGSGQVGPVEAGTFQAEPAQTEPARPSAPQYSDVVDDEFILSVAKDVTMELLEKMKVRATVTAEYVETDDSRGRNPVHVNVHGDDLSILIGRQAETLNALQYIASQIISKEIGRSIPVVVDVEGYRSRRENQLRQLARRMADQAVKTGRRQVLEPMPANERRVIHIELRSHPEVTTESIGEEPRRKITIIPK
jgi:spoIIIJ-associated protein